jgi:hypothetical protein
MHSRHLLIVASSFSLIACSERPVTAPLDALPPSTSLIAAVTETPFTATDVPTAPVDPGVTRITPTRIVIHGLTVGMRVEATDGRLTGSGQVVANGVLDPLTGAGPVWGTFFIDADQGGRWVGSWHGQRSPVGEVWIADIEWRGRGESGPVEGFQLQARETITSPSIVPTGYVGEIEGVIRSH